MDKDIENILAEVKYGVMNFEEAIEAIKLIFERYNQSIIPTP